MASRNGDALPGFALDQRVPRMWYAHRLTRAAPSWDLPDDERWNPMGDKSEKSKNKNKKQGEAKKKRDQEIAAAKRVPPPASPAKK